MKSNINILDWIWRTTDTLVEKDPNFQYKIDFEFEPDQGNNNGLDEIFITIYKREKDEKKSLTNILMRSSDYNSYRIDDCIEEIDNKIKEML